MKTRSDTIQTKIPLQASENSSFFMQQCIRFIDSPKAFQTAAYLAATPALINWLTNSICSKEIHQILTYAFSKKSPLIPKLIIEKNSAFRTGLRSQPTEILKYFFKFYAELNILPGMEYIFNCKNFKEWVQQETSAGELYELLVIIQNSSKTNIKLFYNLLKEQPAIYHHINRCPHEEKFQFLKRWLGRENNPEKISTVLDHITDHGRFLELGMAHHYAAKSKSSLNTMGIFSFTQAPEYDEDPADALLLTHEAEFTLVAAQFSADDLKLLVSNT